MRERSGQLGTFMDGRVHFEYIQMNTNSDEENSSLDMCTPQCPPVLLLQRPYLNVSEGCDGDHLDQISVL